MPRHERPLASQDTPVLRFAGDLRRLRQRAGSPSYRELGARANYSAAALSEAAAGRRLPSLAVTVAFVRACDGDVERWIARWRDLAAAAPGADVESPCPYVGLAAYQIEDAERFFGREVVADTLLRLVDERPFVGVFGASGVGKSSLLRAGLAARAGRATLVFTPGRDPLTELAVAVAGLVDEPVARVRDDLAADPHALRQWLSHAAGDLLLVVDQFEEAFTLCAPRDQRWLVQALTSTAGPRTRVVVGVRADFYGHCGRHPELVAALHGAQLLIGPMSAEELRRAITEPAARVGASLETALVTRVVSDMVGQSAALPMMSHVLAETWRRRRGLALSLAGYEDAGGVEHALARTAERTFGALCTGDQQAARLLFLRLVAPGDGTDDTKRRIRRRELHASDALLDRLAAARLISLDRDGVELVHEALLQAWPRLAAWIAEDRELLPTHRRLTEATEVWQAHGRDPDTLYRGAHLHQAERLRERLNPGERDFLDAGHAAEHAREADRRRQTRRLRRLVATLAVFVVLLVSAAVAVVAAQRAATREHNETISLRAAAVAGGLLRNRPRDAAGSLLHSKAREAAVLALAAYRVAPTTEAHDILVLAHAAASATTLGGGFLAPPGRIAITAEPGEFGKAGRQRLWLRDGVGWRPSGVLPGGAFLYLVSADERTVVTSENRLTAFHLWDVTDPDHPREVATPAGMSSKASVDRSGGLVVDSGRDGAVWWRVTDGIPHRLPAADVEGAAVFSDGRGIVLARRDGDRHTLELWSLGGVRIATLLQGPDMVYPYAGPAGLIIAVGSQSGTVTVLDATDPQAPRTIARTGGVGDPATAAFDPWGRAAAVLHSDTIRMWDTASGDSLLSLRVEGLQLGKPRIVSDNRELLVLDERVGELWRLDPDVDRVVRDMCTARITIDWGRYFPGVPRIPLCP